MIKNPCIFQNLSSSVRGSLFIFLGIVFSFGQKGLTSIENFFGGPIRFVYIGCILSTIFNFTLYFSNFWVYLLSETILSLFSTISIVTLSSLISHTPDFLSGSIMGLNEGLGNFSMFLGALIFPTLMSMFSFSPFLIGGVVTLVLAFASSKVVYIKPKESID